MASLIHHSIPNKFIIVGFCILSICLLAPPVLAQHAVYRSAGEAGRISAPPIPHISISAPIMHAPISTPRMIGASVGSALGTARFRPPRHPIRPFPPVLLVYEAPFLLGEPFWGLSSCWSASCDLFWPWTLDYNAVSSSGPTNYVSQVYEAPAYIYGEERPDLPQLFLKDGTILNVTDYWLVDDQLHFTMIEGEGGKPAEHVIPFDALDLQTTVDVNTRGGFRFVLRNEPVEQYLRDHPEDPPPVVTLPHE
jgi:hypothetical protein